MKLFHTVLTQVSCIKDVGHIRELWHQVENVALVSGRNQTR